MIFQVWLPLVLSILAFAGLVALVIRSAGSGAPGVGQAASISTIFLILPLFAIGLLIAGATGFSIYLLSKLIPRIPPITRAVHSVMEVVHLRTDQLADGAAKPIIKVRSISASISKIFSQH
jgi:hypothetical protein